MSNVIQFPGKKGQTPEPSENAQGSQNSDTSAKNPSRKRKGGAQKSVLAGAVLSILLATVAANRFAFQSQSTSLSSRAGNSSHQSRGIASVGVGRDSKWEKDLAEGLASADVRGPASFNIGRDVTAEEKLHFGALNGIYSLEFSPEKHLLRKIALQGNDSNPAYLSADEFFRDFGLLVNPRFKKAALVGAPSRSQDRIFENYKVFDVDNRPVSDATFERDRHGRLLSMEVTALD